MTGLWIEAMVYPWRVAVIVNGKKFGHTMLYPSRLAAEAEYRDAAHQLKRCIRMGKIQSYHLAMQAIPWCGEEIPKGNIEQ